MEALMNYDTSEKYWLLPDDVGMPDGDEDGAFIMEAWPMIAATAWQEYQRQGRGTVMIDARGESVFCPGSPCECHQCLVDIYDPEHEVVVALHNGDTIRKIAVVAGWPAPPDAYRITPGQRLRLTAH
jgi:hypothetical protein